jgi:hypothetical protein
MNIQITQLERILPNSVIYMVHWNVNQTDGKFTACVYGSSNLPFKDPSDPTFILFDQLTEEQVKQWVIDTMEEEQVKSLQASLASQIEAQKNPVTATGVPW